MALGHFDGSKEPFFGNPRIVNEGIFQLAPTTSNDCCHEPEDLRLVYDLIIHNKKIRSCSQTKDLP
jgi:hypothetical protein